MFKIIALATCLIFIGMGEHGEATPLDDYVNTPDPHYSYTFLKLYEMQGYKIYILNMTSQKWLDETVTKNPIWFVNKAYLFSLYLKSKNYLFFRWHFLCITIPDKIVRSDAAFMIISNGNNDPKE